MRVFIVRHAESYSNTQGRMISTTDLPLTDKGIRQAKAAKISIDRISYPKRFTNAFCSPLLRASQTADIIVNRNIGITQSEYLKEMNLGELEGLTWDESSKNYPHIDAANFLSSADFPRGERYEDVKARCDGFITNCLSVLEENAYVLIVTHGITARVLTNTLLGRPVSHVNYLNWLDNTSFTEIDFDSKKGAGYLKRLNDRQHLTEHHLGTPDYEKWGLFSKTEYSTA